MTLQNIEFGRVSEDTRDRTTFAHTNRAFFIAKLSVTLIELNNNFPEAGFYLTDLMDQAIETKGNIPITEPVLKDRIVRLGIIDPSSNVLRYDHALIVQKAFEMDNATRLEIFNAHNPERTNTSDQATVSAKATSLEDTPGVYAQEPGFGKPKVKSCFSPS